MILRINNPNTEKLLELIIHLSKVIGYEISSHKSAVFVHTNSEQSYKETVQT